MPRSKTRASDREPTLIVEIRGAIDEAGVNSYQLAKRAGIAESAVIRFRSRERSLSLDSAARLADALGLKIARPAKPRKFAGAQAQREAPRTGVR